MAKEIAWGKCAYCELQRAPTVEHYWPKSQYPARMFTWENLLPCCRDCNAEKLADFPLDANEQPLVIDPSATDPLEMFRWSALDGRVELNALDTRAAESHRVLKLDRDASQRFEKLNRVRLWFARSPGDPKTAREQLAIELDKSSAYLGIVRSYLLFPPHTDDKVLIRIGLKHVPDIHEWVRPWLLPPPSAQWPP